MNGVETRDANAERVNRQAKNLELVRAACTNVEPAARSGEWVLKIHFLYIPPESQLPTVCLPAKMLLRHSIEQPWCVWRMPCCLILLAPQPSPRAPRAITNSLLANRNTSNAADHLAVAMAHVLLSRGWE